MSAAPTPHRVVALSGHVDHGKSTLVASLTGMPTDRLAEERRRGLTIELGFTWLDLPATAEHPGTLPVALVDVPGHERFLATMVAGAGCACAAVLVCAADEGPSVQTIEHLEVLRLLDLPVLAVVLTKADRVDAARLSTCEQEIARLLGDGPLAATPIVSVDARSRDELAPLLRLLRTRLEALAPASTDRHPRLWVDRVFSVEGSGTVVTGTLDGGMLAVGSDARVLPAGRTVRIRRLQSLGRDVDSAWAGTRVAINLSGTGRDGVKRGDAIELIGRSRATQTFDALLWAVTPGAGELPTAGRLHVGTALAACTVQPILDAGPPAPGPQRPHEAPRTAPGTPVAVRVRLARALPLRTGDRVVLTSTGGRRVAAGGIVCDPEPTTPRGRAARARHAELVTAVGDAARTEDRGGMVRGLVALHGGLRAAGEVATALGIETGRLQGIAGTLTFGDTVALRERLEELSGQLGGLGAHVVAADELATTLAGLELPRSRADDLVEHLVASGRLRRTSLGLVVEQHADDAVEAREQRYAAVVRRIEEHPFDPPDFRTVADEEGLDHRERMQLLTSDRIVRCGDVIVGQAAFLRAAAVLRALDGSADGFTAAQARDALGSTRRVTVPLLEQLAQRRLSTFDGHVHRMLPLAAE